MKTAKGTEVCAELAAALKGAPSALKNFEAMPPSHQREYNKHVAEAKQAETRERRAAGAIERITAWKR